MMKRPILYFLAAAMPSGVAFLADMPDDPTSKQWVLLAFAVGGPGVVALKAFYDKAAADAASVKKGLLSVALVCGLGLGVVGCKTPLSTVGTMGYAVDGAMSASAELYVTGQLSAEDWAAITNAHAIWIPLYSNALETVIAWPSAPAPVYLKTATATVLSEVNQAQTFGGLIE